MGQGLVFNDVLGDGISFVELIDSLGNDLTVVNAARVSFASESSDISDADQNLIRYLAKHKHFSPFRHVQATFRFHMPEYVARQFYKHCVGSSYVFNDHAWNEVSGRYVELKEEDYIPLHFRGQSTKSKQCSVERSDLEQEEARRIYQQAIAKSRWAYRQLLDMGVCREQARGVLPVAFYTSFVWTASLQAVCNMVALRQSEHAQWEICRYASAVRWLMGSVAPVSFASLLEAMT